MRNFLVWRVNGVSQSFQSVSFGKMIHFEKFRETSRNKCREITTDKYIDGDPILALVVVKGSRPGLVAVAVVPAAGHLTVISFDLNAEGRIVDQDLDHTGAASQLASLWVRSALVVILNFDRTTC